MLSAPECMNDSGTRTDIKAGSTQVCSLAVHATHLLKSVSTAPVEKRPLIYLLVNQIGNFDRDPELMRPLILATIDHIER